MNAFDSMDDESIMKQKACAVFLGQKLANSIQTLVGLSLSHQHPQNMWAGLLPSAKLPKVKGSSKRPIL